MDRTEKLEKALRSVLDLFGEDGWPRVEVFLENSDGRRLYDEGDYSAVLPISDDDADRVRGARRLLEE